ncbi:uncharacterized protein LOC116110630 [Pistacia vera]|uniref:uncharacterized protein LOC116110630 n=1 Tax=Pistacia vera TaxID=55513 RepID=UPI0012633CFC|nr:uncharacterized protein LOC116110630 [Pistacia vera]
MNFHVPTRRHSPSINRYLSPHPYPPPSQSSSDAELDERDIFTTDILPSNHHHNNNTGNNNNPKTTNFSESFGIQAALLESPTNSHSCCHKASIPSPRTIPSVPKPQHERLGFWRFQHQSAPVNVPILATVMKKNNFDETDEDEDANGELVAPHEIVARTHSMVLGSSVVEGVGRMLKGRDLKQVRNAVWGRMGYMD